MVEISMMEIAIGVGGLVVGFALGRMTGINNTGNRHHVDNRGATQGSTITDNEVQFKTAPTFRLRKVSRTIEFAHSVGSRSMSGSPVQVISPTSIGFGDDSIELRL